MKKSTLPIIDSKKYGGQQVAIVHGNIIAAGTDTQALIAEVLRQMPGITWQDILLVSAPIPQRRLPLMTRHLFSFGIRLRQESRIELVPAAELMSQGRRTQGIRATFHLDSGATISVLPARDAKALGIPLRRGKKIVIGGITGEPLNGYQHTISVPFATESINIPVVFVDRPDVPRMLGRDGVFNTFVIVFDEAHRRVAFLNSSTAPVRR